MPGTAGPGLDLSLLRDGDVIRIAADAADPSGEPIPGLTPTATISNGEAEATVALRETDPGRYTGTFEGSAPTTYDVTVIAGELTSTRRIDFAYPAALDFSRAAPGKLAALAEATGGTVHETFAAALETGTRWVLEAVWRPWVVLCLLALLLDLGLRYAPEAFRFMRRSNASPEPRTATAT
jgi:hypothetical protein